MKQSDFKLDAYELCRQYQSPGHIQLAEASCKHGYQLGLLDATNRLKKLTDEVKRVRERSNSPN